MKQEDKNNEPPTSLVAIKQTHLKRQNNATKIELNNTWN